MSENKKKYAYWMKPSMVEEMTEMLDTANATSKSDFVCQAVQFYICKFSERIGKTVKSR